MSSSNRKNNTISLISIVLVLKMGNGACQPRRGGRDSQLVGQKSGVPLHKLEY